MNIDEEGKEINGSMSLSPTPAPTIKQVLLMSCHVPWYLLMDVEHTENIRTPDMRILLSCDLIQGLCSYILIICMN